MRNDQLAEVDAKEAEQSPEPEARPDLEDQRRQFSEFWGEFLKSYPLDDSSQPVKPPSKGTNQRCDMPREADAWMCAVVAPASQNAGVYLTFRRGPISDRVYEALSADRPAINEALGQQ
jgi:hypothetical protein